MWGIHEIGLGLGCIWEDGKCKKSEMTAFFDMVGMLKTHFDMLFGKFIAIDKQKF